MNDLLSKKYSELMAIISSYQRVAVAFSGGVDSTFLLYAAHEALGDDVIAVTSVSSLLPDREKRESMDIATRFGVRHLVVESNELEVEGFAANPKDRCYLCKKDLFSRMAAIAREHGALEVIEGSNIDDEGDYRPGMRALAELDIKSPLREAGFTKADIRELSRELDLPTWDKPSFACLASRIPYGEIISEEKLGMVEAAEQELFEMGFKQFRVRIHGRLARIELSAGEIASFMQEDLRSKVHEDFRRLGFSYVTLDLKGYRTGSMNEMLEKNS